LFVIPGARLPEQNGGQEIPESFLLFRDSCLRRNDIRIQFTVYGILKDST